MASKLYVFSSLLLEYTSTCFIYEWYKTAESFLK